MGIEIKLTDRELPISPPLIDFLHRYISGEGYQGGWHDQRQESLSNEASEAAAVAERHVAEVLQHPVAVRTINRSYQILLSIMFGRLPVLQELQQRYRFVAVVGYPRSGGSYLTKHLFEAIGLDAARTPRVIAHDGFPDPQPFSLEDQNNGYITMMRHMAEYLAMVELFFSGRPTVEGRIIVPKKTYQAAYHGAFFNRVLGAEAEYVITLRHPVPSCISAYEKSGGLPANEKFVVRSNIESIVRRDLAFTGRDPVSSGAGYFDSFLLHWEQYHCDLALTGLSANGNRRTVCLGPASVSDAANGFHSRFGSRSRADRFHAEKKSHRHPEWMTRARESVERVAGVWNAAGLNFPLDEIMEAW